MPNAIADIIAYHERTKHHPGRYARGPRDLDWATQPNPFRRFPGAPLFRLPLATADPTPPAAALFGALPVAPQRLTWETLGLFFELSSGPFRTKGNPRFQLVFADQSLQRQPPSHRGLCRAARPGMAAGQCGCLSLRIVGSRFGTTSATITGARLDGTGFWVGLTSITWREAWKYGERAFRYCQHDVGHALATLRFAGAALGWRVHFLPEWNDARLARLLGLDRPDDFADAERETPELLVRVIVNDSSANPLTPVADTAVNGSDAPTA